MLGIRGVLINAIAVAAVATSMTQCEPSSGLPTGCESDPMTGYVWDSWGVTFVNGSPKGCPVSTFSSGTTTASGVFFDNGTPDFLKGDVRAFNFKDGSPYTQQTNVDLFFSAKDNKWQAQGFISWTSHNHAFDSNSGIDKCLDYLAYTMTQYIDTTPTGFTPYQRVWISYVYPANEPDCSGGGGGDNYVQPKEKSVGVIKPTGASRNRTPRLTSGAFFLIR